MKILFVSQHYWPEPFNFSDICERLVRDGNEVTVLTGLPNYPDGIIYDEYTNFDGRVELHNGVEVIRVPILPRKKSTFSRVVNYYDFSYKAKKKIRFLQGQYDLVFSILSSPVMAGYPAIAAAKKFNVPLIGYILDLWPESLTAGGIKRDSVIYNHYKKVSRKIYNSADLLFVTSPMFENYLQDVLQCESPVEYLPQYAEELFVENNGAKVPEGYCLDKINLTFAGNVGTAQSVQTIIRCADILRADERFLFHIVGSGKDLDECKKLACSLDLSNVVFHGRKPLDDMPAYYKYSSAMLVTFSDIPVLTYTLPRKVQSYMSSSKPILAAATGEVSRVIDEAKCGFVCQSCDAEALASNCIEFAKLSKSDIQTMSNNSYKYYSSEFNKEIFFSTLEDRLNEIMKQNNK